MTKLLMIKLLTPIISEAECLAEPVPPVHTRQFIPPQLMRIHTLKSARTKAVHAFFSDQNDRYPRAV